MNMISLSSGNFLKMQNCCILYRDVAWGWSRENNHLDESAEQCCMVMMVMTSRSRHSPHSPLSHRAVCSCSGWWRMFSVTESSSLFTGSSSVLTSSLRGPRQIIPAGGQASTSRQPAPPSHWPGSPHLSQSIGTNIIVCLTYLVLHLTHHTPPHLTSSASLSSLHFSSSSRLQTLLYLSAYGNFIYYRILEALALDFKIEISWKAFHFTEIFLSILQHLTLYTIYIFKLKPYKLTWQDKDF